MHSFELPTMETPDRKDDKGPEAPAVKSVEKSEPLPERELREVHEELVQLSESAADLEAQVIEKPKSDLDHATLVGKVRDLAYKLSRSPFFIAVLLGMSATGFYDTFREQPQGQDAVRVEAVDSSSRTRPGHERSDIVYGSAEYKEKLNLLRKKLTDAGITSYPATGKEHDVYWKIIDSDAGSVAAIDTAIRDHNEPIYQEYDKVADTHHTDAQKLKETTRISDDEFGYVTAKMDYQHLLETSSRRFGVDPLKRVGYHRYQNFNRDVLEVTRLMNERIEKMNIGSKSHYPPLTPGIVSAIALQEGFAVIIDADGYNPSAIQNSFGSVGLDSLGDAIPKLEAEGLLPKGYEKRAGDKRLASILNFEEEIFGLKPGSVDKATKNEAGMKMTEVNMSERDLLEGLAAIAAEKRKFLIDNLGKSVWASFDPDEQSWLTYAAYQWGEGNVVNLVKHGEVRSRENPSYHDYDDKNKYKTHATPISNFPKYANGRPAGRVTNIHEFIFKDDGRMFQSHNLRDFHAMAAQVAVSAKVSDAFFQNR